MGKAYDQAIARWRCSPKQSAAQNIYLKYWREAKERGCDEQSDEDALLLNKALDLTEGTYHVLMDSADYDETMRAIEIMEELNGDQEEGNSNLIAGMVEAS